MPKQDVVNAQLQLIQSGQLQVLTDALGATFDAGQSEGGGGGFTQAQVDQFIKDATDPLNGQIATLGQQVSDLTAKDAADLQALADAQAKAVSDLAALQVLLDAAISADVADKKLVSDLQGSVSAVQAALDAIKAAVAAVLNPPVPPSA